MINDDSLRKKGNSVLIIHRSSLVVQNMGKLFQLLLRHGGFVIFVVVEIVCFLVIINFNTEKGEIYAYTTDVFSGNLQDKRRELADYLSYKKQRDSLAEENRILQKRLAEALTVQVPYQDSFRIVQLDSLTRNDSTFWVKEARPQYHFIAAKVIGNSVSSANNWIVLNRGSKDGLRPDMGVVTPKGIVGVVRYVSPHFSLVMSVLHRETKISVALVLKKDKAKDKEKALGSLVWEDSNPREMTLKFIPKHFGMISGDQVVTSGYSEFFPKEIPVGTIAKATEEDPENIYFSIAKVRLSQDMATVENVYVIDNIFITELDSLKQHVKNEQ
jgi:rod shape-determining protein MreC